MEEKGFYHPDRGYWQTLSSENLPVYPIGTVEVPLKPGNDYEWDGSRWVLLPPDMDQIAAEVRTKRNALLQQSDWTQVADAPVDQAAWATYRQALRDITMQSGFPENVVWPTPPN